MITETETGPVDIVSERKESMAYFDSLNTPEVSESPEPEETAPEPEALETEELHGDEEQPEPKKRNKQSFQERINELTAARKSVEETATERQRAWEQEKAEYEQRIRQYEQLVQQQQQPQAQSPQQVADWYAQQGVTTDEWEGHPMAQQLKQLQQQNEQLMTWAQSQQEASRHMAERAVHAQRQREAQEASAKYEGVPVDLIDEIVSNNPQYASSPGAADHVAREVLIRFYQWAEQRGLEPREQAPVQASEPGEPVPEPLKRPKSAGARTDRDAKTEPDGKKRRRAGGPDKKAMAMFERLVGGG